MTGHGSPERIDINGEAALVIGEVVEREGGYSIMVNQLGPDLRLPEKGILLIDRVFSP